MVGHSHAGDVHSALIEAKGLAYTLKVAALELEADDRDRSAIGIVAYLIEDRLVAALEVLEQRAVQLSKAA